MCDVRKRLIQRTLNAQQRNWASFFINSIHRRSYTISWCQLSKTFGVIFFCFYFNLFLIPHHDKNKIEGTTHMRKKIGV